MIYIGIDISKYKHDCFIATETDHHSFSFENTKLGFSLMLSTFKKYPKHEMIIGLEATGHYAEKLKSFLTLHGYSFMEINPLLVYKFANSQSLRKTKTDKKDAKIISSYLMTVDFKAYHHQSYHIQALKSFTRFRAKLVSMRTKQYHLMTKTLDCIFPEYRTFMAEQGYSLTSLYILKNFSSPIKISKMTDKHYDSLRKLSMGKFLYSDFFKLKELALNTIGVTQDFHLYKLKSSISYVEQLNIDIEEIETKIKSLMKSFPTYIETIKGVGVLSAAVIISEFGDISLFYSPAALLSYAGLDASVKQSGTSETHGKLVKRGSKFLRSTLMTVCDSLLIHNPLFYKYYAKKKSEGKHHNVAKVHLARKLLRVIYHLETNKIKFDPTLLK